MTRRALVVRGGWDGHDPVATSDSFVPFLTARGFEVRVVDVSAGESPEIYADAAVLAQTDLIVQAVTMAEITGDQLVGLTAAVTAGTGLVGWHGGIADSFRASAGYLHLVGGQFAAHPAGNPAGRSGSEGDNSLTHTVSISELGGEHPITRGIDDFTLTTEQYWVLHDGLNDVLATTTHPVTAWHPWHRPVVSPAVWTREWGRGRIVVATPGHSLDVLNVPQVRTIVERGMLWASRTASE